MLTCRIDPKTIPLQCGVCTKCQARSRLDYPFDKDLANSDDLVAAIMNFVTAATGYRCERTDIHKNPDINVFNTNNQVICRIEAKYLEGYAFMKSLGMVGLHPRETLVVDTPKLRSYINCKTADLAAGNDIPIFVVWKFDRPCNDIGGIAVFQEIDVLKRIFDQHPERHHNRKPAYNDYRNGSRMGITEKYHYSITECEPIELLPKMILAL